ncbi:MAG: hypothetical protein AAF841_04715 [Pseudomonadota bacterium]
MSDVLADFEATAQSLRQAGLSFLSELGPYILAASGHGVASDTRGCARALGVAHALVIRECNSLADELGLLALKDRGDKSQRLFFEPTARGARLLEEAMA